MQRKPIRWPLRCIRRRSGETPRETKRVSDQIHDSERNQRTVKLRKAQESDIFNRILKRFTTTKLVVTLTNVIKAILSSRKDSAFQQNYRPISIEALHIISDEQFEFNGVSGITTSGIRNKRITYIVFLAVARHLTECGMIDLFKRWTN